MAAPAFVACGRETLEPTHTANPSQALERPVPKSLQGTWQGLVAAGDVAGVRSLLGRPHAETDDQGRTFLHIAAIHGRKAVAALLLEQGADPNAHDNEGMTALHHVACMTHWIPAGRDRGMQLYPACGNEHEEIARMLLERGADLHARCRLRYTPVHYAAKGGNLAVARLLLERGADVRAADDDGTTPLHLAALGGNWEPMIPRFTIPGEHALVARLLLEKGAPVDATSLMGTPLSEAVRAHAADVAKLLLDAGASPSAKAPGAMTAPPAHAAAFQGDVKLLSSFLAKISSIEAQDASGRTVLFMGALGGSVDVVRLLIDRGAKIDTRDGSRRTPLHAAASSGSVAVLKLLVERGGEVLATDAEGETLLHAAASGCRATGEMLDFLLGTGIPLNARTRDQRTALTIAETSDCLIGNSPMTDALRRRGAVR